MREIVAVHAAAGERDAPVRPAPGRRDRGSTRSAGRRPSPRSPTAPGRSRACRKFSARATPGSSRPSARVVGAVAIDQLPGPSEIAVVADDTANAAFVAADLLAQAEHGAGSQVLFLTPSPKLLAAVESEIEKQAPKLQRGKHLQGVLENGCTLVLTEDVGEAIGIVEDFAPEHLTLAIKDGRKWAETIRNAGAIFVGNYSPVAAGDFIAGPSHVLPHRRRGQGIFRPDHRPVLPPHQHRRVSPASLHRVRGHIETFCAVEQLDAHARSVTIRFDK